MGSVMGDEEDGEWEDKGDGIAVVIGRGIGDDVEIDGDEVNLHGISFEKCIN